MWLAGEVIQKSALSASLSGSLLPPDLFGAAARCISVELRVRSCERAVNVLGLIPSRVFIIGGRAIRFSWWLRGYRVNSYSNDPAKARTTLSVYEELLKHIVAIVKT